MAKLLVLKKDPVDGKDRHQVSGVSPGNPPPAYSGGGDYSYQGEVVTGFSDFASVDGTPLALVTSASTLRVEGVTAHTAVAGSNFDAPGPDLTKPLVFVPPTGVGDGVPASSAGSALLTVNGTKALLDGDAFDTCKIDGGKKKASVKAQGQNWVRSA